MHKSRNTQRNKYQRDTTRQKKKERTGLTAAIAVLYAFTRCIKWASRTHRLCELVRRLPANNLKNVEVQGPDIPVLPPTVQHLPRRARSRSGFSTTSLRSSSTCPRRSRRPCSCTRRTGSLRVGYCEYKWPQKRTFHLPDFFWIFP